MANPDICSIPNCSKPRNCRGWCKAHYRRWQRHGDPTAGISYQGEKERWLKDRAEHTGDDCMIWPYFINPNGYGAARKNGKSTPAHRLMCELAHGNAPSPNHEAAHSCRTRECVNPNHLRWATKRENSFDKINDGTVMLGEKNHHHKLTVADVLEIRRLKGSCTLAEVGLRFGIHLATVHVIQSRKSWAWLT